MKYSLMIAALLAMCLVFSCACAQTLPGLEVFSPGLTRVSEMIGNGERVEMTAELGVKDMLYVRDVSLLQEMLDGMQLSYLGGGTLIEGGDSLTLTRGGETLLEVSTARSEQKAELAVNGKTFGIDLTDSTWADAAAAGDALAATALLNRVPLLSICEAVEGLSAGEPLTGGFVVMQPFAVERTMSDDGTRLTKINISGSVGREGENPWTVSGFLRQPAGRAPKDTLELTFVQDEDNAITATYSSTRSQSVSKKDKKGRVIVETAWKLSGKLGGYGITTNLKAHLQNDWTADGENLTEKLIMTVTLGHTDRTPGRRMQRLNDMSAKLRCEMAVDSAEAAGCAVTVSEESNLSATFDGNTFLDVSIAGQAAIGGEPHSFAFVGAPVSDPQEIKTAFSDAAVQMAKRIYLQLDGDARKKAEKGLE